MDGIGRTCLGCQAELGPHARFCGKCGRPAWHRCPRARARRPGPRRPRARRSGVRARRRTWVHHRGAAGRGTVVPWLERADRDADRLPRPALTRHRSRRRGPRPCPVLCRPVPCRHTHCPLASGRPTSKGSASSRPRTRKASGPSSPRCNRRQGRRRGRRPGRRAGPPRRPGGRRSGSSVALWGIVLALLVGGGVAGVLIAHPFSTPGLREAASTGPRPGPPGGSSPGTGGSTSAASPAASGTGSTATSATASPSATAVTEQQAATQRGRDAVAERRRPRGDSTAASDVGQLRAKPGRGPQGVRPRGELTAVAALQPGRLPGRAALPPALVSDLTKAWQASIAADQAYAKWANDELAKRCVPNDTTDPGYQATNTPNQQATTYKTAFVAAVEPGRRQVRPHPVPAGAALPAGSAQSDSKARRAELPVSASPSRRGRTGR